MLKVVLPLAVIFLQTSSHILLKMGLSKPYHFSILPINLHTFIGYVGIVANFIIWILYLKIERLSIAVAVTSLMYITFPICASIFLGEKLNIVAYFGFALLLIGVSIVAFATN